MECANHPGVEPRARCVRCGKLLCADCMVESGGRMYCSDCTPFVVLTERSVTSLDRWFSGLDLQRAFAFLLDDPEWLRKLLLGCLMLLGSFLVVPLLIVLGYELELVKAAACGEDLRLPEWDDIGGKIRKGAGLLFVGIVYALPLLLILGGTIALGLAVGGTATGAPRGTAVFFFMLGWLLAVAAGLGHGLVMGAVAGRLAVTGSTREALRVGTVLRKVRQDIRQFLVVLLVSTLLFLLLAPLGLVACFVGALATWFYSMLVTAHLYGQLARMGGGGDE